jgi:hypothetical protein
MPPDGKENSDAFLSGKDVTHVMYQFLNPSEKSRRELSGTSRSQSSGSTNLPSLSQLVSCSQHLSIFGIIACCNNLTPREFTSNGPGNHIANLLPMTTELVASTTFSDDSIVRSPTLLPPTLQTFLQHMIADPTLNLPSQRFCLRA